jgi:glutamyl/glutaminyl-tRNA synthetase
MEYVDAIIADVHRLGLEYKEPITYTSDYFPELLDLAERLIKAGTLYADDTPVEQMRAVRPCALLSAVLSPDSEQCATHCASAPYAMQGMACFACCAFGGCLQSSG